MTTLAGLTAGAWNVDASHSELGFEARHLMVSKVRGRFTDFTSDVTVGDTLENSKVSATVQMASIDTNNAERDGHVKSPDFFDVEQYPTMTFTSTAITEDSLTGDLTIKGVTKPVTFDLDFAGVSKDPWGGTRAGFEASTTINRSDFGLTWNVPLEGGGVLVSEKIKISLDIELVQA